MKFAVVFGICKTGGLINLCFISLKESCCSFPHTNGLLFLVKSYMGFNHFCNSRQNILRMFTIPAKFLHPFTVVGGWSFCIAFNLFLNGLMQTVLSLRNISLPMYWKFVLNNWHFFGIFSDHF